MLFRKPILAPYEKETAVSVSDLLQGLIYKFIKLTKDIFYLHCSHAELNFRWSSLTVFKIKITKTV